MNYDDYEFPDDGLGAKVARFFRGLHPGQLVFLCCVAGEVAFVSGAIVWAKGFTGSFDSVQGLALFLWFDLPALIGFPLVSTGGIGWVGMYLSTSGPKMSRRAEAAVRSAWLGSVFCVVAMVPTWLTAKANALTVVEMFQRGGRLAEIWPTWLFFLLPVLLTQLVAISALICASEDERRTGEQMRAEEEKEAERARIAREREEKERAEREELEIRARRERSWRRLFAAHESARPGIDAEVIELFQTSERPEEWRTEAGIISTLNKRPANVTAALEAYGASGILEERHGPHGREWRSK